MDIDNSLDPRPGPDTGRTYTLARGAHKYLEERLLSDLKLCSRSYEPCIISSSAGLRRQCPISLPITVTVTNTRVSIRIVTRVGAGPLPDRAAVLLLHGQPGRRAVSPVIVILRGLGAVRAVLCKYSVLLPVAVSSSR